MKTKIKNGPAQAGELCGSCAVFASAHAGKVLQGKEKREKKRTWAGPYRGEVWESAGEHSVQLAKGEI